MAGALVAAHDAEIRDYADRVRAVVHAMRDVALSREGSD
jgi:hypothetical protein